MKTWTTCGAAALFAMTAAAAGAQTKTVPGESKIVTAEVEAIESASREVTVKKPDGTYDVFYVPKNIKKFDTLKIGDKVTAKYYENMVLQVKAPGEKDVNKVSTAVTPAGNASASTMAHQTTITATITAIDLKAPSITFSGPHDWKYSTRVKDKSALEKVKVGDKVDITWTEAMILSLDDGK
jgi:hypothetical protein